jgi:hypothetical protein
VRLYATAPGVWCVSYGPTAELWSPPLKEPAAAALAFAYAVAAYGTWRAASIGLLEAMIGYGVQIAFDPPARTAEQVWTAAVCVPASGRKGLVGGDHGGTRAHRP